MYQLFYQKIPTLLRDEIPPPITIDSIQSVEHFSGQVPFFSRWPIVKLQKRVGTRV